MANILVTGLNPAWQKVLFFNELKKGGVNRASEMLECASGKGLNAARILRGLGHNVWILQITGGTNGKKILDYCRQTGLKTLNVKCTQETRCCSTLIDKKKHVETEIIEPFRVPRHESTDAADAVLSSVKKCRIKFDAAVICGQAPDGLPSNVYGNILGAADPGLTVLDVYKNVPLSLFKRASIIKINRHELNAIRKKYPSFSTEMKKTPQKHIMITNGPKEAEYIRYISNKGRSQDSDSVTWKFSIPEQKNLVNPIGAGDVVTAGVTHYCLQGLPYADAFQKALKMGSDSCKTLLPAQLDTIRA